MTDADELATRFDRDRAHLHAVAYRMLGSSNEADDAVQEAWLRLSRSETDDVANLTGWLTTVVSRVCLDMLRSRKSRRESPLEDQGDLPPTEARTDPEHQAILGDAVGSALLVVLDALGPSERLAFVLHDMFAVPFADIAEIAGCTPDAARQLASRARRKVRGTSPDGRVDLARRRQIVDAFLAASRSGHFDALVALLSPDAVVRADAVTVSFGADPVVTGAEAVAQTFSGRARAARPALIDGDPGAVWSQAGDVRVVFTFVVDGDLISEIAMIADPATIAAMELDY